MEFVDSHCHIQSVGSFEGEKITRELWAKSKDRDPAAIIARAEAANVTRMVCVGCHVEDSTLAVAFAGQYEQCWASIGVHPHEAHRYASQAEVKKNLAELANRPKVVAVGECGLDYYYEHSVKEDQITLLKTQIELALSSDLPLIFHVREAFDDFWPIFESYQSVTEPIRGVLHSFTDTPANLERALRHGLCIGVNGIATFTKKPEQLEVYRSIPLENLLLETDAPFLTPNPYRGTICEPYHIRTIAEFLADLRQEPLGRLAQATTQSARTLLGI